MRNVYPIRRGMPMPVSCVIYDCDGVLFDSLEANRKLYNHIAVSMGRAPLTERELHYCHMNTVGDSIHCLFEEDGEAEAKAVRFLKEQVDFKDFIPYLIMEPHLLETLSALREKRIMTAISTNRTTSMPHIMERFRLQPYFDMVVTALDVTRPKPDPESVNLILDRLAVRPEETLYVGDSEIDLGTARSAGVMFVAYKNRAISTGILIENHREILRFLSNGETPQAPFCA
ncbi:MAG: HAD-IA family hydrolase [Syntrophorhabdales bacterium]|jgi:HAD superfamily hydrolase (TIGR01549 family)